MMCRRSITVLLIAFWAEPLGLGEKPKARTFAADKPHREQRLVERLVRSTAALTPIDSEAVPGLEDARQRLTRFECAQTVGGQYSQFVQARLFTVQYFAYPSTVISAEQKPAGNKEVLYALSNMMARRVLLFPPFMKPESVLTRMTSGGAIRINMVSEFENTFGFKHGTMTAGLIQTLILLHEHAHQNGTALNDFPCIGLSVLNTRVVAEACMPEFIERPAAVLASLGPSRDLVRKIRGSAGQGFCRTCHQRIPSASVASLPAR